MSQVPAVNAPLTIKQQSEFARKEMLKDVEAHRLSIEQFLAPFGVSYDFFFSGLQVFLTRQMREDASFFTSVNASSFMEALLRIAMNGLIPDGKQAAIANYKGVATAMFMREGFVAVLWRTGLISAINDQVVTTKEHEAGRFEYEEGDNGFIRHKLDIMRGDEDEVAAAYCVIDTVAGGVMREVVPKKELERIAKMSRSPARKDWAHQMHRKAAIRRIMGKMPKNKDIQRLLDHDDMAYDLSAARRPAADPNIDAAPDHDTLFGNRPIRKKKAKAPPRAIEQGADPVMPPMEMDHVAELMEEARVQEHEEDVALRRAETPEPEENPPFVLRALLTAKNGIQQFDNPDLWYGDIRQKMRTLPEEHLPVFWEKNHGYVVEAGRNGHANLAMQLIELARELGLMGGENQ